MRVVIVLTIVLAIISLLCLMPAGAQFDVGFMGGPVNIGIPYVVGPCFTSAAPFAQGEAILVMANQSTLAHDFTGSFALSFPEIGDPCHGCPPIFSPAIAQTTSESIVATRSYFFADFISG
jgi:hypothetical protein